VCKCAGGGLASIAHEWLLQSLGAVIAQRGIAAVALGRCVLRPWHLESLGTLVKCQADGVRSLYSTIEVCFITAGPITKLFAWGGEESGGHVLRETTSRGLCGLVCPSHTSERGGERPQSWSSQSVRTLVVKIKKTNSNSTRDFSKRINFTRVDPFLWVNSVVKIKKAQESTPSI
jgi:hypothetical protein